MQGLGFGGLGFKVFSKLECLLTRECQRDSGGPLLGIEGGASQIKCTFLGCAPNEDCSILGSILGSPYFGKLSNRRCA